MKRFRKITALLLAAVCLSFCAPAARAEGISDIRFEGRSWEEVIAEFMAEYAVDEWGLTLGYYNTVTGEEHYYEGDKYMDAASMYKVPLNMCFSEMVYNGEMSDDDCIGSYPLSLMREETIVHSNNDLAAVMWTRLGGYYQFRRAIAPYMGEDADTVDPKYYENNFFTPRQIIHCLRLLFEENERFPGVIECMREAEPENYFRLRESRFEIAHKYGFDTVNGRLYMNDCGIVYTDDPILLVCFTFSQYNAYDILADYCTLMCDYAQYHTAERIAEEERLAASDAAAREAVAAELSARATAVYLPEIKAPDAADEAQGAGSSPAYVSGFALFMAVVFMLLGAALISRRRKGAEVNLFWASMAVIIAGIAIMLCIFGLSFGTVFSAPNGDPTETVEAFFGDILAGEYDSACDYLSNLTDLNMEGASSDEAGRLVRSALTESYQYVIAGGEDDGLDAVRNVRFKYLDLELLDSAVAGNIEEAFASVADGRSREELYAPDGSVIPEVREEIYLSALKMVLANAEDCYTVAELSLSLSYDGEQWLINADSDLLSALAGGAPVN